jgi:membrane protein implicated in regulation of membrane protease activity
MKTRNIKVLTATLFVLTAALIANLCLGASGVSAGEILRALVRGEKDSVGARILLYVRLPRALAAMLAAFFGAELWLQITLFVVVSVGMLLALRPLLKKYITPKKLRTNVDSVIGSQGLVLEPIDNLAGTGRVKLGGMEWSARSENGEPIETGTIVKVEKIEGVKVFVSTVNVPVK